MAKKETAVTGAELIQEDTVISAEEEKKLVCYRVSWPGGVSLREGPGQAYRRKTVLPFGTTGLGEDPTDFLRENRNKDDAAWVKIHCADAGSGWVDSVYLERVADGPTE